MRKYYAQDPCFITAKYDGVCAETGKPIKKGERCAYYPKGNKIYHVDSNQAGELRGYLEDLAMGHDY